MLVSCNIALRMGLDLVLVQTPQDLWRAVKAAGCHLLEAGRDRMTSRIGGSSKPAPLHAQG
jgi:hypothetical protein